VAAGLLAPAAMAGPAHAEVAIASFSLTPSTVQAGGNPDVIVDLALAASSGDTPKDATISLPPGLLADTGAVTPCAALEFQAYACPVSSQIGDGSITATVLGQTVSLPTAEYLLAPQGSSLATIGVIVSFFDSPVAAMTAQVGVRSSPGVGLDLSVPSIPDQLQGLRLQVTALRVKLFGAVDQHAVIRNPTSCARADSTVTIESYGAPSTPVSAGSSFTPAGCSSLAFRPRLSGTATPDEQGNGVAFAATIAQGPAEAATEAVSITLPSSIAPRLSAISAACTIADSARCPPVGSATVRTPLLGAPLHADLVLLAHPAAPPTLEARFPPPLAITLQGRPSLGTAGLSVAFSGLPDVPLTAVQVVLSGGPRSLLTATPKLCSEGATLGGDLRAHSGATTQVAPVLTILGSCSSAGDGGGAPGGGGAGGSGGGTSSPAVKPPTAHAWCSGLAGKAPELKIGILAGPGAPGLERVKVRLPHGLVLDRSRLTRGLVVMLDGRPRTRGTELAKKWLSLSVRGHRRAAITLRRPALHVRRPLAVRRRWRAGRLHVTVAITDATGVERILRPAATARPKTRRSR